MSSKCSMSAFLKTHTHPCSLSNRHAAMHACRRPLCEYLYTSKHSTLTLHISLAVAAVPKLAVFSNLQFGGVGGGDAIAGLHAVTLLQLRQSAHQTSVGCIQRCYALLLHTHTHRCIWGRSIFTDIMNFFFLRCGVSHVGVRCIQQRKTPQKTYWVISPLSSNHQKMLCIIPFIVIYNCWVNLPNLFWFYQERPMWDGRLGWNFWRRGCSDLWESQVDFITELGGVFGRDASFHFKKSYIWKYWNNVKKCNFGRSNISYNSLKLQKTLRIIRPLSLTWFNPCYQVKPYECQEGEGDDYCIWGCG